MKDFESVEIHSLSSVFIFFSPSTPQCPRRERGHRGFLERVFQPLEQISCKRCTSLQSRQPRPVCSVELLLSKQPPTVQSSPFVRVLSFCNQRMSLFFCFFFSKPKEDTRTEFKGGGHFFVWFGLNSNPSSPSFIQLTQIVFVDGLLNHIVDLLLNCHFFLKHCTLSLQLFLHPLHYFNSVRIPQWLWAQKKTKKVNSQS